MKLFQKVQLLTDKYLNQEIKKGDIGTILEDYDGKHYEIDFSDPNGITIVLFSFPEEELESIE